ncbi:MAG: arginine repressor [Myxococcales bacterium]
MDHGMSPRTLERRGGADKAARHDAIRRMIRARAIGTQEELARLLVAEGIHVTQATLSRDLAQLRAVRQPRPAGGASYELEPAEGGREAPNEMGELVLSISDNDLLSVVRTLTGAAPAVARAIDVARLPEILGTIAGDDTIFVTPVRGVSARKLTSALRALLKPSGRAAAERT